MLIKTLLSGGGTLIPLIIPKSAMKGVSLLNPSILNYNNEIIVNIRNCNYTLWHTDLNQPFESSHGPLLYVHPENEQILNTDNILCNMSDDGVLSNINRLDMLQSTQLWEFHGLEDARLINWDDKLFLCGVRRDTTPNGEGRMELSEISNFKEINRYRIPSTSKESYCEKNWMPILDIPYHFVKWSDPTEVVKFDLEQNSTHTVLLKEQNVVNHNDFRGGSQVIRLDENHRIAIIHETQLYYNEMGRKNAKYLHRFIIWDNDWNIVKMSHLFNFMEFDIEFCCGFTIKDNTAYISFSCQDNSAFVVTFNKELLNIII